MSYSKTLQNYYALAHKPCVRSKKKFFYRKECGSIPNTLWVFSPYGPGSVDTHAYRTRIESFFSINYESKDGRELRHRIDRVTHRRNDKKTTSPSILDILNLYLYTSSFGIELQPKRSNAVFFISIPANFSVLRMPAQQP